MQGPKPKDFDRLVKKVYAAQQPAAFVFNCQMGRGRTTTGMVIASLVLMKLNHVLDPVLDGASKAASGAPESANSAFETPAWFQEGIERSLASEVCTATQTRHLHQCLLGLKPRGLLFSWGGDVQLASLHWHLVSVASLIRVRVVPAKAWVL